MYTVMAPVAKVKKIWRGYKAKHESGMEMRERDWASDDERDAWWPWDADAEWIECWIEIAKKKCMLSLSE